MRNKKTLLIYILLCIALVLTSIATTLALVTDKHNKDSNIIKFDKVSLYADNNGSKLSINVNNLLGNGEVLFDRNINDNEYLYVNPTNDTADCYIRFKLCYTLGSEELDEENSEVLDYLNDVDYLYKGFEANNVDGQDYGFTLQNGYYYLVTETTGEGRLLKVVTKNDYNKNFVMSERYVLNVNQEHIDAVVNLSKTHDLMLAVEVEAIQCLNLSNVIDENIFEGNENIIDSSNEQTLEAQYGNASISDYEESIYMNTLKDIGDGTEKYPFLIYNMDKLKEIRDNINSNLNSYESVYFKLMKDLNLKSEQWTPIGSQQAYPFKSYFDGNGHTIENLNINNSLTYQGLFGFVDNAIIKNLTVKGNITATANYAGGIAANITNSTIENCVNYINITAVTYVGGIGGNSVNSLIKECKNYGTIKATGERAGGIIGNSSNDMKFERCENMSEAKVVSQGWYAGGICAIIHNNSTTVQCINRGYVESGSGVGGIIGCLYTGTQTSAIIGKIHECVNYGNVKLVQRGSSNASMVGGICSYTYRLNAEIFYCYNRGVVNGNGKISNSGYTWAGGILGEGVESKNTTVKYCYNANSVTAYGDGMDALVGGVNYWVFGQTLPFVGIYYCYSTQSTVGIDVPIGNREISNCGTVSAANLKILSGVNSTFKNYYQVDTNNINDGYPLLNWQVEDLQ